MVLRTTQEFNHIPETGEIETEDTQEKVMMVGTLERERTEATLEKVRGTAKGIGGTQGRVKIRRITVIEDTLDRMITDTLRRVMVTEGTQGRVMAMVSVQRTKTTTTIMEFTIMSVRTVMVSIAELVELLFLLSTDLSGMRMRVPR